MVENHNDPALHTASPHPGILVADHFSESYGFGAFREEGTRDWLLTLTLDGRGEYRHRGETIACLPGDVLIFLPGTPHHYYTPRDSHWEFVWTHFVPEPRWVEWLQLPGNDTGLIRLHIAQGNSREKLFSTFQRLIHSTRESGYYSELLSLNALEEILLLIAKLASQEKKLDQRIEETLACLTHDLKHAHTVRELAAHVSLSPSRFAHLFKQQVGDSVVETLLKLRLRYASRLLEHTDLPIAEVAEQVGFRSPFYFSKQFKISFGVSPSRYRARARGGSS